MAERETIPGYGVDGHCSSERPLPNCSDRINPWFAGSLHGHHRNRRSISRRAAGASLERPDYLGANLLLSGCRSWVSQIRTPETAILPMGVLVEKSVAYGDHIARADYLVFANRRG